MWSCQVLLGDRDLGSYGLPLGTELILGRDPHVDIVVGERSVSRRHCSLSGTRDGVAVRDLKSANGVYHQGQAVAEAVVRDGEDIQIGMALLRVTRESGRTGMIPIQDLVNSFTPVDPQSNSNVAAALSQGTSDSTRSVLDVSSSAYKSLEKDRLTQLITAGRSLSEPLELQDLLERVMDHLFEILQVKRAALVLCEPDGSLRPEALRPSNLGELSEVCSQSILRSVIDSGQAQIIDDAQLDQGFNMAHSILAANIKAAICAPLTSHNHVIGALYADFPGRAQLYKQSDLEFFGAFASLSAVAIDNARLRAETRLNERLVLDMEIAGEIQMGLLPDDDLLVPGAEVNWVYIPSKQVGGDFYDCTVVSDDEIAFILGDVSGKSVGAALFMARLMSFLRATVPEDPSPGAALTRTNALLGTRVNSSMFATACYILWNRRKRTLRWASAGHHPALVLEPSAADFVELPGTGIPLGVDHEFTYTGREITVEPNSLVLLYTDGIAEARALSGDLFGLDALKQVVLANRDQPVKVITDALEVAVKHHCRGSTFTPDDIALLAARLES